MIAASKMRRLIELGYGDRLRRMLGRVSPLDRFVPRPDDPQAMDMQTSFVKSKANFAVCLGGTGSGKTEAAAYRTAKYLLETRPMRERCPFWIIGETFELVCSVCWEEKLSNYIPRSMILATDMYKPMRNWPHAVILRHPDNRNRPGWVIEFKSYTQGREMMQGRSIGGYWFNEEAPMPLVVEVQGRCRDYNSPGWADFTPLSSYVSDWEDAYNDPERAEAGWKFYHLNSDRNTELSEEWRTNFLQYSVPEEERETRRVGTFASFAGMVFKEFRRAIHVLPQDHPITLGKVPADWMKIRGVDFGFSNPFCCLWVCVDRDGRYYVYDEHYASQKLMAYHAAAINSRPWGNTPYHGNTYCDDEDPGRIGELLQLGVPNCTGTVKSLGVGPRISFLRSLMIVKQDGKPKLFISPRCVNLIKEIGKYHWSTPIGVKERMRNPADLPVDYNNHAIDAMGYAIYTHAMGGVNAAKSIRREWEPKDRNIQLARRDPDRR